MFEYRFVVELKKSYIRFLIMFLLGAQNYADESSDIVVTTNPTVQRFTQILLFESFASMNSMIPIFRDK